jgi:hypothetical protein
MKDRGLSFFAITSGSGVGLLPTLPALIVASRGDANDRARMRWQRSQSCSMRLDVGQTCWRNRDEGLATGRVSALDETSRVGFFPHRKTWARCAPGLHDLRIVARLTPKPFQQIKHERFYGIRHRRASGAVALSAV